VATVKSYLWLQEFPPVPGRKTVSVLVLLKSSGMTLGNILWHRHWRQYVFEPEPNTVWSDGCMIEVQTKIRELMAARKS
jgi:hypothetical protein